MANPDLLAHRAQFEKSITRLSDGIYTAVGYAASNVHMIEGDSSITIIDTSESTKAAENILAEFQKLSDKPIARIIYTHSHRDHISGATVFAQGKDIPILAHYGFKSDLVAVSDIIPAPNMALGRRTQAQFGIGLSGDERVSLGCGPGDRPMQGLGAGFLPPTQFIEAKRDIDLDGVLARLIFAPGETADHLMVWLPEQRILFPGDNWYYSFPNLYAIRGTAYRDFIAPEDHTGEAVDKFLGKFRYYAEVPAGVYEGQKNDGPVISFDTAVGIAVRADMDEDTVYQVTKAFWDNIDQVTSEAPWAKALNLEFAASKRGLAELHPGAARYYREVGVLK